MRLRVLSYNIHKAKGLDGRFAPDRIVEILRHYDPDVALLQEVDRHSSRSNHLELAAEIARRLDYRYKSVGINHACKRGKYGNATLSRFPISAQRNIDLTVGWRKRRGAQHTRIHVRNSVRDYEVDVFNVHLGLAARMQREQVRRLLESSDVSSLTTQRACIVAGDMNDWGGLLRRAFDDAGFGCASNRRPDSRWSIRTFPSFAPTGGLDKIFYRGPLQLLHAHASRLRLARVASDHLPIVADFELGAVGWRPALSAADAALV